MEEKKRKSSRSFELEKGGKRSFDLQKTSARKFDLEKDSDEVSLEELKKDLLADGKIDAEEVNKLREVLFADGKIDQEEADFLFEINDAVSGRSNDSSWKAFFVEAISDYLLNDEKSPGVIDEDEGKWLEAKINNDGKLDTVERALVASLRRKSKSMPKSLSTVLSQVASRFNLKKDEVPTAEAAAAMAALAATKAKASRFSLEKENNDTANINIEELKKEILYDGKIDREEVETLRKALYADGSIDQKEADFLFELNNAVSGNNKDSSWDQFFVQAISDYLLKDERSPGVIDEEEGKWLVEKIGADGQVDGVEKQLLDHLRKNAKKMPATVTALLTSAVASNAAPSDSVNLHQLKKEILADGKMDKDEVNQLRKTLYADGKIDQEEADFIFELNDAVSGKKNDPTWNQFFVQVISDYLLNDEKSPGVIDEEEGKWLVEKIGADGQVDDVEKQLLDYLKKNAKKMPTSVAALLNGNTFPPTPPISEGGNQPNGKWKKYAAVLAGLVVLGGVGYYLSQQGDNTPAPVAEVVEQTKSSVATPENSAGTTQDGQDQDGTTTDNATIETSADDASEGGVPANSGQNREGAVPAQTSNAPVTDSETPAKKNPEPVANTSRQNATSTAHVTSVSGAVEEAAKDVIRGKYGNGDVRKRNLGDRYAEIQSVVNEMYRKGLVR